MPAEKSQNGSSSTSFTATENSNLKPDTSNTGINNSTSYNFDSTEDKSKEYESSELSDLGDDQSEAETDRMDFLDEENSNPDNVSDLSALSKLTELARLKEIDSDDDLDEQKEQSEGPSAENGNQNGKRSDVEHDDDEPAVKKAKVEDEQDNVSTEHQNGDTNDSSKVQVDGSEVEIENVNDKATVKVENGEPVVEMKPQEDAKEQEEKEEAAPEEEDGDHGDHEAEDDDEEDEEEEDEGAEGQEENGVDLNEQRQLAVNDLISIEESFAQIKDKMYQDKLKFLAHELQLCLEGSHPELTKIYYKINGFYQDSIRLANHTLNYRLRCINNETIATRTSIHQDFIKRMMDTKNDMISETTSKWYKINKERNQMDQLVPDYGFRALPEIPAADPDHNLNVNVSILNGNTANGYAANGYDEVVPLSKKEIKHTRLVELVQQRNDLNQELGILNGLVQLHGFPSAVSLSSDDNSNHHKQPELLLRKATDEEVAEDFRAMGIPI